MDEQNRRRQGWKLWLLIVLMLVLAVYVGGYFALSDVMVGWLPHGGRTRFFDHSWLVRLYRPLAAVESIAYGVSVELIPMDKLREVSLHGPPNLSPSTP